jgi:hypothetical protein
MDPVERFKNYLNEEEIPYFSDFDKEVFDYILNNLENLQPGDSSDPLDVVNATVNRDDNIIYHSEGIKFLEGFQGENGARGWTGALEYAFERAADFDNESYIGELIQAGNWSGLANYIILMRGEEIIVASEVLSQKVASNEPTLDAGDIEDLEQELELFING